MCYSSECAHARRRSMQETEDLHRPHTLLPAIINSRRQTIQWRRSSLIMYIRRSSRSSSNSRAISMHHISVERNRRKQMNEHLRALRSLMPCFYVKRGDQASIIGGAIEYIKELQLLLHSLETKKQRKGTSVLQPKTPPPPVLSRPAASGSRLCSFEAVTGLGACCNSSVADVEAKIMGSNVILRVLSKRAPGQVVKVITVLERHAFEILHLSISSMEDTVLYSYYMKIGLQCQLSLEELASEIQQSIKQGVISHSS